MPSYKLNWPKPAEVLFLQACLLPGTRALESWHRYQAEPPPFTGAEIKLYLPVLYHHFEKQALSVEELPFTKKEADLAGLQSRRDYHLRAALLGRLAQGGQEILILKGVALLAAGYADAALRPMSDADVYVPPERLETFTGQLERKEGGRAYFADPLSELIQTKHAAPYLFSDGENLDVHWNIFWEYPSRVLDQDLWDHAVTVCLGEARFRRLCDADHLVLTCCHGLRRNSKSNLNWVLDAALLLRRNGKTMDWTRVLQLAERTGLSGILSEALSYLEKHFLPGEIPFSVLAQLSSIKISRWKEFYLRVAYDRPRTLLEAGYFFWRQYGIRHPNEPWFGKWFGFIKSLARVLEVRDSAGFLRALAGRLQKRRWLFGKTVEEGQPEKYGALFKRLLDRAGISPKSFVAPGILSFAAAILEGCVIGLLVPMGRGLIEGRFDFIETSRILKPLALLHAALGASSRMTFFCVLIGVMIVLIALKNGMDYLSRLGFAANTARFQNELRKKVFESYLSAGKYFFDRQNAGRLGHVLMAHTQAVAQMLDFLQLALRSFFLLAAYAAVMGFISWPLLLAVCVLFPGLHFLLRRVIGQMSRISVEEVQAANNLSAKTHNLLSGMTLVKAYRAESAQAASFGRMSDACEELSIRMHRRKLAIEPIMEVVSFSVYLVVAALAGFFILPGKPGFAAAFLAFIVILRRASSSFGIFSRVRANAADTEGPLREAAGFLDQPALFSVSGGSREFQTLQSGIRFEHLAFGYAGGREVLRDIHFRLPKGSMTALVGPTGAGKTTLIHLLMRFYDCPPASIFLDETDLREYTLDSLARRMALVEQEPVLFHDTLEQNLLFGLEKSLPLEPGRLEEVVRLAQLEEMVRALPRGLETLIGDRGVKLSGGEKQRVAIARAMLKNPDILILDEATSALDSKTEAAIQKALAELIQGRTCLVIAHRLSTILKADQILVLNDGEIREQGNLRELLAREGPFFELWQYQKLMESVLQPATP